MFVLECSKHEGERRKLLHLQSGVVIIILTLKMLLKLLVIFTSFVCNFSRPRIVWLCWWYARVKSFGLQFNPQNMLHCRPIFWNVMEGGGSKLYLPFLCNIHKIYYNYVIGLGVICCVLVLCEFTDQEIAMWKWHNSWMVFRWICTYSSTRSLKLK